MVAMKHLEECISGVSYHDSREIFVLVVLTHVVDRHKCLFPDLVVTVVQSERAYAVQKGIVCNKDLKVFFRDSSQNV